jgi:hypothetical protein
MSVEPNYSKYATCMDEIKRRQRAIDDILQKQQTTTFHYTNVEFVALQYRKIFELIILASLASHEQFFEGLTRKLSKEWQISKIISLVRAKNVAFYPKPIDRVPSSQPGVKDDWLDVSDGFLTIDELTRAHGTIGNLMHANNPYRNDLLINEIEEQFTIWRQKTMRLLNNHLIRFPGDKNILYVGMQSIETGSVHTNLFVRRE